MLMMRRRTFALLAKAVVKIMCRNDQYNSDGQKQIFQRGKKLFQYKKNKSRQENKHRSKRTVMLNVTVIQRISANKKRNSDHAPFKKKIVYNVDPKNRKAGYHQRQQGTVYGTCGRSSNT